MSALFPVRPRFSPGGFLLTTRRFSMIVAGAVIMAFNINTFVHAGALIPGGFTGLTLLVQEVSRRYWNVRIPFSVILYVLNAVPAVISFKFIGKRYSIYSCVMIVLSGILTDWMPALSTRPMFVELLRLHDALLSSVFGGLLNAAAVALCLRAGATSGGTDFIAIFISERYGRDAWGYILAGNCVILTAAAWLFDLNCALYSIIFQFVTTCAVGALYRGYQARTLLIITNKPDEIYTVIRERTNHDATSFNGIGRYKMAERVLLYSVVAANEAAPLTREIRRLDPAAFINEVKTEHLNGLFYRRPKD